MASNNVHKTTLIGSILTAILASICCIGPIVFAVLGISGAGFILKFEVYRPLFIILAVGLLGTAFYFTYEKNRLRNVPMEPIARTQNRTESIRSFFGSRPF